MGNVKHFRKICIISFDFMRTVSAGFSVADRTCKQTENDSKYAVRNSVKVKRTSLINPYPADQNFQFLHYMPNSRLPVDIVFMRFSWVFPNKNSMQRGCLSAFFLT